MWDFVMDKSGAEAGFLRELRVPLPINIPSASPQSSSPRTSGSPANLQSICFSTIIFTITRGWHNRPGAAAVPIASQPNKKNMARPLLES
jgi:hypothetical protein